MRECARDRFTSFNVFLRASRRAAKRLEASYAALIEARVLYLSLDALLRDTRIAPKLRSCSPLLTRLCETSMMFTPRKCKARMRMHVPCKFYSTVRVRVRARRVESAPAD